MRLFGRSANPAPWGDGFDADGWTDVASVTSWEYCHSDEYIRVFPALIRADAPARCILAHLAECLAVLVWRKHVRCGGKKTIALHSMPQTECLNMGRDKEPDWFAAKFRMSTLTGSSKSFDHDAHEEDAAIAVIDELLVMSRSRSRLTFDEPTAARIAFWAGIHPVYFWPEALLSHQRFTALGWLGHCARGRDAFQTADIAEYFSEIIRSDAYEMKQIHDDTLARFVASPKLVERLHRFAIGRLSGRRMAFRM